MYVGHHWDTVFSQRFPAGHGFAAHGAAAVNKMISSFIVGEPRSRIGSMATNDGVHTQRFAFDGKVQRKTQLRRIITSNHRKTGANGV